MSVKITQGDLRKVKLFVNLCDKLGIDYNTHHSLQRKAIKLLDEQERIHVQTKTVQTKTVYETVLSSATNALSTWWSWGTQSTEKSTEETATTEEEETAATDEEGDTSFDEKVAKILIALLEERAEKVAPHRENTVSYDECEC